MDASISEVAELDPQFSASCTGSCTAERCLGFEQCHLCQGTPEGGNSETLSFQNCGLEALYVLAGDTDDVSLRMRKARKGRQMVKPCKKGDHLHQSRLGCSLKWPAVGNFSRHSVYE